MTRGKYCRMSSCSSRTSRLSYRWNLTLEFTAKAFQSPYFLMKDWDQASNRCLTKWDWVRMAFSKDNPWALTSLKATDNSRTRKNSNRTKSRVNQIRSLKVEISMGSPCRMIEAKFKELSASKMASTSWTLAKVKVRAISRATRSSKMRTLRAFSSTECILLAQETPKWIDPTPQTTFVLNARRIIPSGSPLITEFTFASIVQAPTEDLVSRSASWGPWRWTISPMFKSWC